MELQELTPVLTAPGPFVTVHVPSESAVEQAADRYEASWRAIAQQLAEQGVDERTREAVLAARGEHSEGESRLVVASAADGNVLLATSLSSQPAAPVVELAPLPHLLPLIVETVERVPYVLIRNGRSGGEVVAYFDASTAVDKIETEGHTPDPRFAPRGAGWGNRVFENRTLNSIEAGGKELAAAANALAQEVGAHLVIAVGDPQALAIVRDQLPQGLTLIEVSGGRGGDGGEDVTAQHVHEALSRWRIDRTLELLEEYSQERGQHKRAVDGVTDVVEALRKAQVRTLVVTTQTDQDATLFFGPEPSLVAMTAAELTGLGVDAPQSGPLVDVLLRAALGTGASVELVPHQLETAPRGGVGALLRYDDDSL